MRIYDPRVGRFLSTDPLTQEYPWYTPYQFAGNTPIQAIDIDGLEEYVVIQEMYKNGSPKKITVNYVVDKNDIKQKINHRFKEVLKKHPDGSLDLGGYLTDKKVIRIIRNPGGSESAKPDDNLTGQEQAIVNNSSTNGSPLNPENTRWKLGIAGKDYRSESERNTEVTQDKIAQRTFRYIAPSFNNTKLKPNTTLSNFNGSSNYFSGGSFVPNGGQLGNDLISSLNALATQLSKAENVKSITVNLNQAANFNVGTSEFNSVQQYGKAAVNNAVNFLQRRLKGAGIRVNSGNTTTTPNSTVPDLISSGKAVGINITIQ
jgi:hypothetical protein